MYPLIILLFIVLPVLEIVLFIVIAHLIGWVNTLILTLATTLLGMILFRIQSEKQKRDFQYLNGPADHSVVGRLFNHLAANLLIMPGFITDIIGLVLLIPPVRNLIFRFASYWIFKRLFSQSRSFNGFSFEMPWQQSNDGRSNNQQWQDSNELFDQEDNYNQEDNYDYRNNNDPEARRNSGNKNNNNDNDEIIDVEFKVKH